ncbi:NUDIX hydrolase [Actinomadura harenae]|uniref:NUDIX hydrolase n=1 Tax=Actinomadura harenae TaxID=2483351 RepID=UPI0013153AE3|nr:NUDIX domain-containing protein [Actinomadura harenae]
MIKHATASVLILCRRWADARWRMALIRHPRLDLWMVPGGHVEENENTAEAAVREAREETGLSGLRLLPAPGPRLPEGFPLRSVPQPWWITELTRCPPDNHLDQPHGHIDHIWLMGCQEPAPAAPGEHPLEWFTAEQIAALQEIPPDTQVLAAMVFAELDEHTGLAGIVTATA